MSASVPTAVDPLCPDPPPSLHRPLAGIRVSDRSGSACSRRLGRSLPLATALRRGRWPVAVLVVLALAACADEDIAPPPPRPVIVQPVETADSGRDALRYPGRVESATGTDLAFMVQGRLQQVRVSPGETVRAGQLLAELDSTDYRVEQRQAAVAERTAAADLGRRRELAAEGILSPAAVELAEAEFANARAQREAADRQVAHTRLLAPYAARVATRHVDPGTVMNPGEPVIGLHTDAGFDVAVELSERDAARLRLDAGLVATGHLLSDPDAPPLALTYREHATAPQQPSRTYRLVFRTRPPEGITLLPGMAVRVSIPDPRPDTLPAGVARVPLSALLSDAGGGSVIWMVEDGRAQRRQVELVELGEGWALVRGELADGADVIVAGARQVIEGQRVDPRQRR